MAGGEREAHPADLSRDVIPDELVGEVLNRLWAKFALTNQHIPVAENHRVGVLGILWSKVVPILPAKDLTKAESGVQ